MVSLFVSGHFLHLLVGEKDELAPLLFLALVEGVVVVSLVEMNLLFLKPVLGELDVLVVGFVPKSLLFSRPLAGVVA